MNWIILLLNRIYHTPLLLSIYRVVKCIVRLSTGTTELYRLCNATIITQQQLENEGTDEKLDVQDIRVPSNIICRIDQSIYYSKQLQQEKYQLGITDCSVESILERIVYKKAFPSTRVPAAYVLKYSLIQIYQSNQVLSTVEQHVRTRYDPDNKAHEAQLLLLWSKMKPDTPVERKSKQWVEIGFQGSDPATDFRGMGIQGLNDLVYFVEHYPTHAHSVLQHASHPTYWYPYAIVGINITKFAYQLLESKQLQSYLYQYGTTLDIFQEFYCYLFYHFNQFWISHEPKPTVMDFEAKFIEFKAHITKDLMQKKVMPFASFIHN
ncbi:ELMO/CED-12 family-domain-containing protein, partial [Gilbertella persicaria]|uniref:ELMO/CED-12 family-domain-containing protein n=1 Tax=Gilbertella persicaria TaxID=101096 RepID=UPI00222093A4